MFIMVLAEALLAVEPVFEGVDVGWMRALLRFEFVEPMTGIWPRVEQRTKVEGFVLSVDVKGDVKVEEVWRCQGETAGG